MAQAVSRYSPARFWIVRLGSFLLIAGLAYVLQFIISPAVGSYDRVLIINSLLFGGLAVSLNMINGITGQFSMGHAAFYLVGAYTAAKLTVTYYKVQPLDDWMWLTLMVVAAAAAAAIAGLIVGLPSLRLRGDYLAIVTLGFGEIARIFITNQDGKAQSIMQLDLGGAAYFRVPHRLTEIAYVFLFFVFTVVVARNLLKTAHGLSFLAVREDELAAEATGVPTTRIKVTAFVLGAALAGMGGAMFAHFNGSISPDYFKMDVSFLIVAMVVIGGTGSITGAALAGMGLKLLEEALRKVGSFPAIDLLAYILAIIVISLLAKALKPKREDYEKPAVKIPFLILGLIACIGLVYIGYLNFKSGVSPVIKFGFLSLVVGALVGLLGMTAGRAALPRFGFFALCAAIVYFLRIPVAAALHKFGPLEDLLKATTYTASDLRWAIFAVTLIIVMLVRSQGLFGHHEFSWSWVGKLFGRQTPRTEVAV